MIYLSLCGQAMESGGLNIIVPRNLTGSNIINKSGFFFVVGKALFKETCQYGGFLSSGYGPVSQMTSCCLHDVKF